MHCRAQCPGHWQLLIAVLSSNASFCAFHKSKAGNRASGIPGFSLPVHWWLVAVHIAYVCQSMCSCLCHLWLIWQTWGGACSPATLLFYERKWKEWIQQILRQRQPLKVLFVWREGHVGNMAYPASHCRGLFELNQNASLILELTNIPHRILELAHEGKN